MVICFLRQNKIGIAPSQTQPAMERQLAGKNVSVSFAMVTMSTSHGETITTTAEQQQRQQQPSA